MMTGSSSTEETSTVADAASGAPEACDGAGEGKHHRARGLLAIGLFKLSKALFFYAMGLAALHLIHTNIGDVLLQASRFLHIDPDWHYMELLQDKVDLITGHQLRNAAMLSCGYATVSLVEGVGLMLQQTWAEYLTLVLTICALPWEIFELIRHATAMKAGLLVVNLGVLAYLLWFIRWHRKMKHEAGGTL